MRNKTPLLTNLDGAHASPGGAGDVRPVGLAPLRRRRPWQAYLPPFDRWQAAVGTAPAPALEGRVTKVVGLTIEAQGPSVEVGHLCTIQRADGEPLLAEVVGFRQENVLLMPLGEMWGVAAGARVAATGRVLAVPVGPHLLGRVLDGLGQPADGLPMPAPVDWYPAVSSPPAPLTRPPINRVLGVGVRAIDALLTCGRGQRLGIFAGSGVGKSTLLGMMARYTEADVNVIALVGERGREVREFIERELGEEGLKRSVVVMATSDQPPLVRIKAAYVATAVAEYFRDQGQDVVLVMDSVTRFAMALREVGLAAGEPPATRGYTPTVFAQLPKLLERSGQAPMGSITGFYTVLVEGDDISEPVADTVRGILDGHLVLSRRLSDEGHYPPIDVLASISRIMSHVVDKEHAAAAARFRAWLSQYREAEDLVAIGAYKRGTNPDLDEALDRLPDMRALLRQDAGEGVTFKEARRALLQVVRGDEP